MLQNLPRILMNTSCTAFINGLDERGAKKSVGTVLAGAVPEREDPLLPLYIGLAVAAALCLLALFALLLKKVCK